eukprot:gene7859-5651_t
MGVVSDHDVFHNMSTDRDMKSFLKGKKFDKENLEQLMLALGSKRKNIDEEEEGPFIFQEAPDYKGGCQERPKPSEEDNNEGDEGEGGDEDLDQDEYEEEEGNEEEEEEEGEDTMEEDED